MEAKVGVQKTSLRRGKEYAMGASMYGRHSQWLEQNGRA